MDVRAAVEQIVQKYGTRSPYELADLMDIDIERHELGQLNGYYLEVFGTKQIVLNSNIEDIKEMYVLAHEIGHRVLHQGFNEPFLKYNTGLATGRYETEADRFAMELLVSDDMIDEAKNCNYTIEQISKALGLPEELIKLRLK